MYRRNPGRHDDRPFSAKFAPVEDRGPWRPSETHSRMHWNDVPFQRKGSFEEWSSFSDDLGAQMGRGRKLPEHHPRHSPVKYDGRQRTPPNHSALGYAERRRLSPKVFEERPALRSPRRLHRERLQSPTPPPYEPHHRESTAHWEQNERRPTNPNGPGNVSGRNQRDVRGRSPRGRSHGWSQERRHDRVEHGYHTEEHKEGYGQRSSFSERSQPRRSEFRDHRPPKRTREMGHPVEHRNYSPVHHGPVIVEHGHGISHYEEKNRDDEGVRRECGPHRGPSHDSHRREAGPTTFEDARMVPSTKRQTGPAEGGMRNMMPLRGESYSKNFKDQRPAVPAKDVDLRPKRLKHADHSPSNWQPQRPDGKERGISVQEQAHQQAHFQYRNSNTDKESRLGATNCETLKIKVDMSHKVGQNSSLSYSSDRQLSLDLVNVGRQRLDFLPLLEHTGTFKETSLHSGTFAQEIITLVHQVKENYFKGQDITLNERFAFMQSPHLDEKEGTVSRQIKVSVPDTMPIFSKIAHMQQRPQMISDPDDLRHDLERRRQERLEGVKVTISGGGFSMEKESTYIADDCIGDDPHWSELHQGVEQWGQPMDDQHQRRLGANRKTLKRNFNQHRNQMIPNRRPYQDSGNGGSW
ncbi:BCLAF1 and THRAP3 family member 3 isoform X2 [Denticeps clupeoides]|nr:BCLAF1 and THRAP3 family member 3-like isoform X2 [Denticeps clupeoides]